MSTNPNLFSIPIVTTRTASPALWDSGGFDGTTGHAICVTNEFGGRMPPIFRHKEVRRPNWQHALMLLRPGNYVVHVDTNPQSTNVRVAQVVGFDLTKRESPTASLELVAMGDGAKWDGDKPPPRLLTAAVYEALKAAQTYDRVEPVYAAEFRAVGAV